MVTSFFFVLLPRVRVVFEDGVTQSVACLPGSEESSESFQNYSKLSCKLLGPLKVETDEGSLDPIELVNLARIYRVEVSTRLSEQEV